MACIMMYKKYHTLKLAQHCKIAFFFTVLRQVSHRIQHGHRPR